MTGADGELYSVAGLIVFVLFCIAQASPSGEDTRHKFKELNSLFSEIQRAFVTKLAN
jgi:hypothetical protein